MERSTGLSSFKIPESHDLPSLAALFEDNFSIDWVVELTGKKARQVLLELEQGVRRGLLLNKSPGVYCFCDSYNRKACLDRLTLEERERLHQLIANLLMRELPDGDTKAHNLARHLLHIANDIEGCRWLIKAGDLYLQSFRHEDALQCYNKAILDLSILSGEEADNIYAEVAIKYGKISTARIDTAQVDRVLKQAMNRARKWKNENLQALLEMHLAKNEWLRSRNTSSIKHFERGFSIARNLGNPKLLRSANTFSIHSFYWQGRFLDAIDWYQKSVPDVEKYPQGRFPILAGLTVGRCYAHVGQITQGLGMLDSIRTHCREKGDLYLAFRADAALGAIMLDVFRLEEAFRYLESAVKEASRWDNKWVPIMGNLMLAFAHYLNGDNRQCINYLNKFLEKTKKMHVTLRHYPYIMELCWAMKQGKLPPAGGLSIEREIYRMIRSKNVFMKGIAYRYQAFLQRLEGLPHETIIRSLNLSRRWLEESGHQIELAASLIELARQYLLQEDQGRAQEKAKKAYGLLVPFNVKLFPDELRFFIKDPLLSQNLLEEILNLGKEMPSIRDNKGLLHYIISSVNRITGAERGAIFLLEKNEEPPLLQVRASKNLTWEKIDDPSFHSSMKMIKEVALAGKGRILQTDSKDEIDSSPHFDIRSSICVPMVFRNRMLGVLYHDNRLLKNAFKESDLDILSYFAALAAIALDNTNTYDENKAPSQKPKGEKLHNDDKSLQDFSLDGIIGSTHAMKHLLHRVGQVAITNTAVLIMGETGVGKELVARAIHRHSSRKDKPFIRVDCNALTDSLIHSELFGHEKGAFTGAVGRRIGRFELAHGGTIFLDEIGDLPLDVQVRLLGVLQSNEFERVGGSKTIHSDFRLIAATNKDLEEEVQAKRFREDLFYRLHVFPIYVMPLRERKEDIPELAYYFLKACSSKAGKTFDGIPKKELDKLLEYDWPGNVRELQHLMESCCISSNSYHFEVPKLSIDCPKFFARNPGTTLKENEGLHILWALEKTGWKVRGPGGAAEILDINPSTLESRMKKLSIWRPQGILKGRKDRPLHALRERFREAAFSG